MKYLISHSIATIVLCVGGMSPALSQACAPLDTAEVLQAEQQRLSAQMKNDLDTMAQLLDDELIYIRNSAIVDSKASFLDSMRKGDTVYEFIEHSNDSVRIYDCMAILTGQGKCAHRTKTTQTDPSLSQYLAKKQGSIENGFVASNQGALIPSLNHVANLWK